MNLSRPETAAPTDDSKRGRRHGSRIASRASTRAIGAVLFPIALLIPSFFWILRDRRVWPWDQAWYGEVSVDLWYLTRTPAAWYRDMLHAIGMKPPMLVWIGQLLVPLRHLFGSVEAALLLGILLSQGAVLVLIYRTSLRVLPGSSSVGFFALGVAASGQAFIGLSHQYMVEPLQCLAVAWIVWIALESHGWPRARTAIHLIAALILGMLAKASTPIYILVPLAGILWTLLRSRRDWGWRAELRRGPSQAIVALIAIAAPLGFAWYSVNYQTVLQHARDASSGEIALAYGTRAPVIQKIGLWLQFSRSAFLDPWLTWILPAAALAAVLVARPQSKTWRRPLAIALCCAFQIALLVAVLSLNDSVETRFLYPVLPYVALIAAPIFSAARLRIVHALVLVAILAQWAVVHRASFGAMQAIHRPFPWLVPIDTDGARRDELRDVVRLTSIAPGYNVIAVEQPWLNSNSAAFFAARNRLDTGVRSQYTSLGYAQKDLSAAMKRLDELDVRFVITLQESAQPAPNFLNLVSVPVLREMQSDQRFRPLAFSSRQGVLIFERRAAPAAGER